MMWISPGSVSIICLPFVLVLQVLPFGGAYNLCIQKLAEIPEDVIFLHRGFILLSVRPLDNAALLEMLLSFPSLPTRFQNESLLFRGLVWEDDISHFCLAKTLKAPPWFQRLVRFLSYPSQVVPGFTNRHWGENLLILDFSCISTKSSVLFFSVFQQEYSWA